LNVYFFVFKISVSGRAGVKVGFIGLGRMGQRMCLRLIDSGIQQLTVYGRKPEATTPLVKAGGQAAGSIGETCARSDVVITMLPHDEAVQQVVLSPGGMRDSLPPNCIHLAMGTHSVQTIRMAEHAHAEAHQFLVAAPVLGRPDMAATGQLGLVVGGHESAIGRCEPLFKIFGRRTFVVGAKPEHATAIKLANSFLLGCAIQSMGEAFSVVRKYGVSPNVLYDVITEGLFSAPAYKVYGAIIADETYDKVGFTTLLGLKDVSLVMAAADTARIPLPSGNTLRDRLLGAIAHGDGEKDWAVIAREQARASGMD
jgi:3-hydroxyisobutyrate dehydrogenase-like beta-hydroxyacid dehydrogenase